MPKPVVGVLSVYHVERRPVQILPPIVLNERIHARLPHLRLYQDVLFLVVDLGCCIEKVAENLTKAFHFVYGPGFSFLLNDRLFPAKSRGPPNPEHSLCEGLLPINLPLLGVCILFVLECCLGV